MRTSLASCLLPLAVVAAACGARTGLDAPEDARAPSDAGPACDASVPFAYAADSAHALYRYDPNTGRATLLGTPACAMGGGAWTMSATREHAYLVDDSDWSIHRVDLATMQCARTAFAPAAVGLQPEFGVAAAGAGASERVYVYGLASSGATTLFVCDAARFQCTAVGVPHPLPAGAFPVNLTFDEVTQTVFAFAPQLPGALVFEIDPSNAAVRLARATGVTTDSTWATLAYGSELRLWVGSDVVGYDLGTGGRTDTRMGAPDAVGASAFVDCP